VFWVSSEVECLGLLETINLNFGKGPKNFGAKMNPDRDSVYTAD